MRRNGEGWRKETNGEMMVHWAVGFVRLPMTREKEKARKPVGSNGPRTRSPRGLRGAKAAYDRAQQHWKPEPRSLEPVYAWKTILQSRGSSTREGQNVACVYIRGKGRRETSKGEGKKGKKKKEKWRDSTRACLNGAPYLRCRPVTVYKRGWSERWRGAERRRETKEGN